MNGIQKLEQDYEHARTYAVTQSNKFKNAAANEGRDLGPGERSAIESAVNAATEARTRLDRVKGNQSQSAEIDRLTAGMGSNNGHSIGRPSNQATRIVGGGTLGAEFVNSDAFRWLKDNKNSLAGKWNSPVSEISAATLSTDAASGGDLVIADFRPGILALPTRPTRVSDLFAVAQTDSNLITYMKETTFTNASAAVAEGALKPESTLIFDAVSDPVQKVAHWLPVTDEMLEDVPALRSYLDVRLRLGVELTLEDQLLNGNGTAPNLRGILNRTGLATAIARGVDTNADAILKQIAAIETATNLRPDAVVVHPDNWKTILMSKDANGQYYGAGPFAGPQGPTLWGLPVAITSAIVANTALVGCFKTAAQIYRKGGLRVDISNSHSDFFIRNMVAVRAELRAALATYRTSAFGVVTNLA
ncbi:MAG TPA: phage major capsid protein [Gemmatimonadaceae bacterium]|nr:phage major capsid protein [Gemmatimonadaceae bacterium]